MTHYISGNNKGLLISFDGIDSSGKETQSAMLAERLRHHGHKVHQFTTPDYATKSGKELKARLQNKIGNWQETSWEEKMSYFARNRAEHREEVMQALSRGDVVIYDRYVPSSLAFITVEATRAQEADLLRDRIQRAVDREEYTNNGMPKEGLSIFLDIPPHVASELLEKRKEKLQDEDEYTDHLEVQERLYNEYDIMYKAEPDRYLRISCVSGNELLSAEDIAELVWEGLTERFSQLK